MHNCTLSAIQIALFDSSSPPCQQSPRTRLHYRTLPSSWCCVEKASQSTEPLSSQQTKTPFPSRIPSPTCQTIICKCPRSVSLSSDARKPPAWPCCGPAEAALHVSGRESSCSHMRGTRRAVESGVHERAPEWSRQDGLRRQ